MLVVLQCTVRRKVVSAIVRIVAKLLNQPLPLAISSLLTSKCFNFYGSSLQQKNVFYGKSKAIIVIKQIIHTFYAGSAIRILRR